MSFPFGKVIKEHVIGDHKIIEYLVGDAWKEFDGQIQFSIDSVSYDTLDQAIIGSVCKKYSPGDHDLSIYVMKLIPGIESAPTDIIINIPASVDLIVSRMTKGDAFRMSGNEYNTHMNNVTMSVLSDFHSMTTEQFNQKYSEYL